ncbi:type II and III secretion system protein family protein [Pseudomonas chlororaphis]|uniref:Type II and III secretion system protein family protein n=1 Tax=Pseudomonas chlororaphis subsp. aurantiaca TaxID=86192 RepID=A0AAJ0ZK89_9PSED|nr:type II and III secretion system protein family protein [Pseudomonas chlororaphis]AZE06826.1 Flp pilus assembly protein CpaC [Pseudomonas chlororaphis subsp. aureofaciens]MBP5063285.1 type II and III secretion system protein family protein [Pseudomonas chlororaphis]MBU4633534.1 type II and III secretion system protein family protein [Pseudomonas chlororaphis subsp. aurantiaca]QTT96139.1 type II and III secretion system protein family protein [Pseudomonas chlororaphis]
MNSDYVQVLRRVAWTLIVAGLPTGMAMAASNNCAGLQPLPSTVEVGEGQQTIMHSPVAITRLAVGDPKIADVYLNGRDSYLLTGIAPGATSLMVWTACDKEPRQSMVFVQGKGPHSMVSSLLPPSEDPSLASQVQTDIRFVEVSRTKLKEAGTSIFGKSGNFLFSSPGTVPLVTVTPGNIGGLAPRIPLNNGQFNIGFGGGNVLGLINALEGSGFAYTLARPSLVALSGQSASFLAGGEVPIPVPSSGSDSITIQYKEFGIRLTLTPTIVGNDRIALKVAPEVSELDFNNGITVNGISVPALVVRRTDTSISLADGESFVISGLISTTNTTAVSKFPGLGEIPILGAFFRDSSIRREEKELLMIVTPHLVQPLAVNAKLPVLPGEPLRNYDPNWFRLYFLENGNYDQAASGLSQ